MSLNYTIKTVDDKEYNLADYKDKVLLLVNTASE
jgi:glutathione peroxidase-family protein